MLDLGWSELLVIGVAALIVVGPKDLPRMLRTLGQYTSRAKGIAREFQRSMDEAARQADIDELKDVKKSLDEVRDAQYKAQRDLSQSFLDGPAKTAAKKSETAKPATKPAAKSTDKPAAKPVAKAAAEPAAKAEPEPGSAGGA
ncbi:MAG TPA: Sec-independent protein translocase protein TatB [Thermohalobaculum sp.]|nr:Sec-independent protein translocase protein TatB [Thermohalobaculum sp.]